MFLKTKQLSLLFENSQFLLDPNVPCVFLKHEKLPEENLEKLIFFQHIQHVLHIYKVEYVTPNGNSSAAYPFQETPHTSSEILVRDISMIEKNMPEDYRLEGLFVVKENLIAVCKYQTQIRACLLSFSLFSSNDIKKPENQLMSLDFFQNQSVKIIFKHEKLFILRGYHTSHDVTLYSFDCVSQEWDILFQVPFLNFHYIQGVEIEENKNVYILSSHLKANIVRQNFMSIFCLKNKKWLMESKTIFETDNRYEKLELLERGQLALYNKQTFVLTLYYFQTELDLIKNLILPMGVERSTDYQFCKILPNGYILVVLENHLEILDVSTRKPYCIGIFLGKDYFINDDGVVLFKLRQSKILENKPQEIAFYFDLSFFKSQKSIHWALERRDCFPEITLLKESFLKDAASTLRMLESVTLKKYIDELLPFLEIKYIFSLRKKFFMYINLLRVLFCYQWIKNKLTLKAEEIPACIERLYQLKRENGIEDPRPYLLKDYFDEFADGILTEIEFSAYKRLNIQGGFSPLFLKLYHLVKGFWASIPHQSSALSLRDFPKEMIEHIASYLDVKDFMSLYGTCSYVREALTYKCKEMPAKIFMSRHITLFRLEPSNFTQKIKKMFSSLLQKPETNAAIEFPGAEYSLVELFQAMTKNPFSLSQESIIALLSFWREGRISLQEILYLVFETASPQIKKALFERLYVLYKVEHAIKDFDAFVRWQINKVECAKANGAGLNQIRAFI
jgi:hypothetical protein